MKNLANKKIAILGYGIENKSLLKWLVQHGAKNITICDQNKNIKKQVFSDLKNIINFQLGKKYLNNLEKFNVIYRTPGIPINHPKLIKAKKAGVEISSQIKLFFNICKAKIIGVTGTKGKGTTSSLMYEMLKNSIKKSKVYLAGNIGNAPIEFVDKLKEKDWVILELSSFQLHDLDKSPHIAVVLNITSDHLDYHKNVKEYIDAKTNIVRNQKNTDYAVINLDYLTSFKFAAVSPSDNDWYFSTKKSVDLGTYIRWNKTDSKWGEIVLRTTNKDIVIDKTYNTKLVGRHNLENICAASTVAHLVGASVKNIKKTINSFKPIENRLEFFHKKNGVMFFNDSASTNPDTTIAAINSFEKPIILIAGGSDKALKYDKLGKNIDTKKIKKLYLFGKTKDKIRKSIKDKKVDINIYKDLEAIVKDVKKYIADKDVIVFSPASASFDMFKNYKDRGNKFKKYIRKYFK